jgi:hypothetical protein
VAQRDPQLRLLVTRHRMMASHERGQAASRGCMPLRLIFRPGPGRGDFLIPIKFVEVSQLSP